jgi:PAS domain S-box-containing protein
MNINRINKNILIETTRPRVTDEIIITVHRDGWAIDHSENNPAHYISLEKLLNFKYHLELPSETMRKIRHQIQASYDIYKAIKETFQIDLKDKTYPYEITFIPQSPVRILLILRRIIEQPELLDIKTKYLTLIRQNTTGIILLDSEFNIKEINSRACNLLDRHIKHLENRSIFELLYPEDIKKVQRYLKMPYSVKVNNSGLELRFIKRNEDFTWLLFSLNPVSDGTIKPDRYIMVIHDINEFKKSEAEKKREKMRFDLEVGNIYWIDEDSSHLSYQIIEGYMELGFYGLVISRQKKDELENFIKGDYDYLRLGRTDFSESEYNVGSYFYKKIQNSPKRSIIMLDNLDYFLTYTDWFFTSVLVDRLRDFVILTNSIMIIILNRDALIGAGHGYILKEGIELNLLDKKNLSNEHIEILRFAHRRNNDGFKPTFKDICKEQNITKPTCRKKVDELMQNKLIIELKNGRERQFIITELGLKYIK